MMGIISHVVFPEPGRFFHFISLQALIVRNFQLRWFPLVQNMDLMKTIWGWINTWKDDFFLMIMASACCGHAFRLVSVCDVFWGRYFTEDVWSGIRLLIFLEASVCDRCCISCVVGHGFLLQFTSKLPR